MRALATGAVFGLAMLGCQAITGPGDGGYPLVPVAGDQELGQAERLAYHEDAVRLALRHLEDTNSAARSDVEPPAELVESLYSALVRVYLTAHPARDSVVELYGIHTFPDPPTREVLVGVDPAHGWTAAWRELQAQTGEPAVDTLVSQYGLTVRVYYEWTIGDYALLRAAEPLNAAALADRFESIPGVLAADPNGWGGDGNDIRATVRDGGWRLDYSVGFGDCPSGCIHRHTWSFAVGADGEVRYLGASGAPAPPPPGS